MYQPPGYDRLSKKKKMTSYLLSSDHLTRERESKLLLLAKTMEYFALFKYPGS